MISVTWKSKTALTTPYSPTKESNVQSPEQIAERLDEKHLKLKPEQLQEMATFLKEGLENLITDNKLRGIDPIVAVLCYDMYEGKTQMRVHVMDTGFNTPLEKKLSMKTVAAAVYKEHLFPVAAGLTCEAWVSKQNPEEARKYLMPADDPERKEVAFVAISSFYRPDGNPMTYHDLRYMSRDKNDVVSWDGGWLNEDGSAGEFTCSAILDHFFGGYVGFAKGEEDPETYLHVRKVVHLSEDSSQNR